MATHAALRNRHTVSRSVSCIAFDCLLSASVIEINEAQRLCRHHRMSQNRNHFTTELSSASGPPLARTDATDRQTDRQTDRRTGSQTDGQTNRQVSERLNRQSKLTDRPTNTQTDGQAEGQTDRQTC